MVAILFFKKKSKIGCLYGSYLVFLKDWAEVSLNIKNGVTIIWSVKSAGLQNLPFLKFRKKNSQLWCPGNQCGQLNRSLEI